MSASQTHSFKKNVLPFILATLGEFSALFFWLWLFFRPTGPWSYVLALIILLAGFLVERLAVLYWVSQVFGAEVGITGSKKSTLQKMIGLLMITGSEIIVWSIWFFVDQAAGVVAGAIVLIVGEQLQHTWDLALLNNKPMKSYILHPTTIFITVLEVGGGLLMLHFFKADKYNTGGAIMLVALTIEHVVQGSLIHPTAAVPAPVA